MTLRRAGMHVTWLAVAMLAGCHRQAADPAAITAEEQAQLNDAAATLDAQGNAVPADGADTNASDDNEQG